MRKFHLFFCFFLFFAIVIIFLFFAKFPKKVRTIHFSVLSPNWCIGVTNVTKTTKNNHVRFTEEGEYEGSCTRNGCIYSIVLEEGYTYHIDTADYKTGNPRTEFYLSLSSDSCYISIPKKLLNNKEEIFVCCDKDIIKSTTNKLKEIISFTNNEIIDMKKSLITYAQHKKQSQFDLKNEVIFIFENRNNNLINNQLTPILYIKIDDSNHPFLREVIFSKKYLREPFL